MTTSASALNSAFPADTFGIEITLDDPAADLRREIAELRQAVSSFSPPPGRGQGRAEGHWQRLLSSIKSIFAPPLPPSNSPHRGESLTISPPLGGTKGGQLSQEAANLLARDPLFLDVETTDKFKKDDPRLCEIAVIDTQGHVLFSTLVNPQKPISPEASAKNGITNADVADAPTWRQIEPLLRRVIEGRVVIAHYAKFDSQFIPTHWGIEFVCSKQLTDKILGKPTDLYPFWDIKENPLLGGSLPARLHQLGLQPGPAHTAAGDCLSTLRLVRHLAGETQPIELTY